MASNAKAVLINRLASTPGKGLGANTGLGTADIVVPNFPQLPNRLTEQSIKEFSEAVDRWRTNFQAQFPIPVGGQTTSITIDPTEKIASALDAAVAIINRQISGINGIVSSQLESLQSQIDQIDSGSVTAVDVQAIIKSARYVHNQGFPSSKWTIQHNLGWYPSVTAVDMSQNVFFGDVEYIDNNTCTLTLFSENSGKAYVN
jgi:hypothetical protein